MTSLLKYYVACLVPKSLNQGSSVAVKMGMRWSPHWKLKMDSSILLRRASSFYLNHQLLYCMRRYTQVAVRFKILGVLHSHSLNWLISYVIRLIMWSLRGTLREQPTCITLIFSLDWRPSKNIFSGISREMSTTIFLISSGLAWIPGRLLFQLGFYKSTWSFWHNYWVVQWKGSENNEP